jgi:hypothetical protein
MQSAWIAALAVAGTAAAAQTPYDGLYYPADASGWDCARVGMDGGAVAVRGGRFEGVENSCTLANPVNVRDMQATLYDAACTGEGVVSQERFMLMQAAQGGIWVIRDGWATRLARCPEG